MKFDTSENLHSHRNKKDFSKKCIEALLDSGLEPDQCRSGIFSFYKLFKNDPYQPAQWEAFIMAGVISVFHFSPLWENSKRLYHHNSPKRYIGMSATQIAKYKKN